MKAFALCLLLWAGPAGAAFQAVTLPAPSHPLIRVLAIGANTSGAMNVLPEALQKQSGTMSELALINLGEYTEGIANEREMLVIGHETGVIVLPRTVVPGDVAKHVSLANDGQPARYFPITETAIKDALQHLSNSTPAQAYQQLLEECIKTSADCGTLPEDAAGASASRRTSSLKRGDKAMIRIVDAGRTTYKETQVMRVFNSHVWEAGSAEPYDRTTGQWTGNNWNPGVTRYLEPIPEGGIPPNQ